MADRELPVLVAALGEEEARELVEASRVGRHSWVMLKWPPGQEGPHLLEVYTPSSNDPLRLLAEPLGTSGERGYALRVYPWEENEAEEAHSFPDVTPDQLVGRSLAGGRFEIISVVGEGSIGAVYRARHTGLGIMVAVKVLHEAFQRDVEFSRRFYAEALALSRLDHPNLVHIYDFGQEADGLLYISMAFVDGMTLRAVSMKEKKLLEMKRVVSIMLQVCGGLGHAHARGLIHRDVKPDNVMILTREDDDGNTVENVKVLDFGFAVPPNISSDVAQRLAGTPVYMSPEQCLGEELDARSDVYAVGIMLYELATGTVPFLGRDAESIRNKQVNMPPPPIALKNPKVDPRFDRLVQKALSKRREDRHPNMQELRADLKMLLVPEGTPASAIKVTGSHDRPSLPSMHSMPVPPPVSASGAPRKAKPSQADWLESPQENYARFMQAQGGPPPSGGGGAAVGTGGAASASAHLVADALSKDVSSWLGELAHERDPHASIKKMKELDGAVRILAQRADVRALQMVSAVVQGLIDRLDRKNPAAEDAHAALSNVAKLFNDPEVLAPIARKLLTQEQGRESAAELLADAKVAGAYALYGARTKIEVDQKARVAFVTTMKSLGESGLPVVRAALERVFDATMSGQHRGAAELAEDLLLSMPPSPNDEVSGHIVVKYAACPVPNVCRAAARALPRVWAERAKPTLLALLGHSDDGVVIAAMVGLREIGEIDVEAVTRIAATLDAGRPRGQAFLATLTAFLQAADGPARDVAKPLLERLPS